MDIIKRTWSLFVKKLFCEKTNLFYDYCVGNADDCAVWHLPSPEAIKLQVPNPNGWGTGMEDSVLTAGSVIDALISMYKTGEAGDKIKAEADGLETEGNKADGYVEYGIGLNKDFINTPWSCYVQVTGKGGDRSGFDGSFGVKYNF